MNTTWHLEEDVTLAPDAQTIGETNESNYNITIH